MSLEVKSRMVRKRDPLTSPSKSSDAVYNLFWEHVTSVPRSSQVPECFWLSQPCKYTQQAGSQRPGCLAPRRVKMGFLPPDGKG